MADAWKAYKHLPDMPTEVYADPGWHDWYFREKKPDSVAKFIRSDLTPPASVVEAMEKALRDMRSRFSPFPREDTEGWREEHEACEAADTALADLTAWKDAQ